LRLSFTLPLPPTSNHRLIPAKGSGRLITSPKMREWKKEAEDTLFRQRDWGNPTITGRVAVTLVITWPDRRKRDIDGPVKPVLDALVKAGILKDDSLIKELAVIVEDEIGEGVVGIEIDIID